MERCWDKLNPLTPVAISKLLELIGKVSLYPRLLAGDHSRLGHKPDFRLGWSSEYVRKSMHAKDGVSVACRASRDAPACAVKSGQSISQFSLVTGDPMDVKGITL